MNAAEAKQAYEEFQAIAANAEKATRAYLADVCVDRENAASFSEDSAEFWICMLDSGRGAFGSRCEENGLNPADFGISV